MEVKNKKCIITGSAQGLGKEFASVLLSHGAQVCISDVREEIARATLNEFQLIYGKKNICFIKCDVTLEEEFTDLIAEAENYFNVDCIDILVNNAGINTNLGWKKCMDVNIIGVMIGSEIVLRRMRENSKKGTIINIASMAGQMTGMGAYMAGYTVSKWGVVALTRTLAWDVDYHGVSIKALCPAWADTNIMSMVDTMPPHSKMAVNRSVKASGGLMSPEYVAKGFYKLVSECDNGSVMMVVNHTPFTIIPDTARFKILGMLIISKIINKIFGIDLVTIQHQTLFILLLIFFMCSILICLF